MKKILIFAAHPDDEILGVGGTIQYLKERNAHITVCLVTDGSSTQYKNNPTIWEQKKQEYTRALNLLNIDDIIHLDYPDLQLDTIPHYQLNEKLENIINLVKPDTIFTHSENDLNKDHRLIYDATTIITRSSHGFIKKVYCYEVLSSSEWNTEKPFIPTHFVNIEKYIDKKKEAFSILESEVREYPHPRSLQGIEILAKYRGLQGRHKYAESFKLIKAYDL